MYDTIETYKRTLTIDIKVREDSEFYYVSVWVNDRFITQYKNKDYYKAKNKALNFAITYYEV